MHRTRADHMAQVGAVTTTMVPFSVDIPPSACRTRPALGKRQATASRKKPLVLHSATLQLGVHVTTLLSVATNNLQKAVAGTVVLFAPGNIPPSVLLDCHSLTSGGDGALHDWLAAHRWPTCPSAMHQLLATRRFHDTVLVDIDVRRWFAMLLAENFSDDVRAFYKHLHASDAPTTSISVAVARMHGEGSTEVKLFAHCNWLVRQTTLHLRQQDCCLNVDPSTPRSHMQATQQWSTCGDTACCDHL